METKENEQVESAVEETKQEETLEVSEAELKRQVKSLLGEETQEKTQEETQKEETQEETKVPEPIVTDELIEQFPTLKMYRGKPVSQLAPIYDKLVRKLTSEIQKRKELEGKLEKTSLDGIGEPPDPIENRAEFDKWLKKRDELVKSQVKQPEPEVDYLIEVQKRLPNVDAREVVNDWAKHNSRRLFDETGNLRPEVQALYQRDPELMIEEITNFYELSSKANKNEDTIEQESKKQAYLKTKENFKEARKAKKESSEVHAVSRTTELTPEDELLQKIYNSVQSG